jgi:hypothetical protein
MGPYSSWDIGPEGFSCAGEEYGIEIFEDYFENGIPPHARDWLWDNFDGKEVARGFDAGPEYGYDTLRAEVSSVAEAYHDLSQEEKKSLHDKKLGELKERQAKSADRKDWTNILGAGLLANLHDYRGPSEYKIQFEKVIKQVIEDSSAMDDELSIDLKDEEDWA